MEQKTTHTETCGAAGCGRRGFRPSGSALIMAVVLTSLLAVVGAVFVMSARIDKMATSAVSENRQLDLAVDSVVAQISQLLVADGPLADMPGAGFYYDYPDANNPWLASLEPYNDSGVYKWRRISDVTGYLTSKGFDTTDVEVEPTGLDTTVYVRNYPELRVDRDGRFVDNNGQLLNEGVSADADGDGIADSKWIRLDDVRGGSAEPIYAAIRIIDNCAMINVNTAHDFNPNSGVPQEVDGSSLMQVNLDNLARGTDTVDRLHDARCGGTAVSAAQFNNDMIRRIENPSDGYIAFDISDELELRNRFLLTSSFESRIEQAAVWKATLDGADVTNVPFGQATLKFENNWIPRVIADTATIDDYDRRHVLAAYSFDRAVAADAAKSRNINKSTGQQLYTAVREALAAADFNDIDLERTAAQIAANIADYQDADDDVTVVDVNGLGLCYGFERPCVYISELVQRPEADGSISYAVELYRPYSADGDPNGWQLAIQDPNETVDVDWTAATGDFWINWWNNRTTPVFSGTSKVHLRRPVVHNSITTMVAVDSVEVPGGAWASYERDITTNRCMNRKWLIQAASTPGAANAYSSGAKPIQAHPANLDFTGVGEISKVLRKSAYPPDGVGYNLNADEEEEVKIDLSDPNYQRLFNYLTVFDPATDTIDNDGDGDTDEADPGKPEQTPEFKIPGRININTAPWYIIAQLPWVSHRIDPPFDSINYSLAKAIVAYRDRASLAAEGGPNYSARPGGPGFRSIGELNNVIQGPDAYRIDYYALDGADQGQLPDLTAGDGAADDFEERDLIFARISNLVTVRSDVFTAYILVRMGTDGPQKRMIAVLDRSNVYRSNGKVNVVALHPVPDPR